MPIKLGQQPMTRNLVPKRREALYTGMRDYQAAMINNLTASWQGTYKTAAQTVYSQLQMLVSRSREQVENNDYAKFFMTLLRTNVVGPQGFDFQSQAADPRGGADLNARSTLNAHFKRWSRSRRADKYQRMSFIEMQRLFIRSVATDGEALIRIHTGAKWGPYGFALEFIDPGFLDIHYSDTGGGGNVIEMGIEYDADDMPVAYHISRFPRGQLKSIASGYGMTGTRERIPASDILHCFLTERVGQPRGIPWLATPLLRMNMLSGFEEAALTNARAGAGKMGFLEQLSDLSQVFDQDPDSGEYIDEADPGTWHRLPPGVKAVEYDPTYPNNEFGPFTKALLRGIAAGLGVAYHTFANDLEGVNYSSGRLGSQNERDAWMILQAWMKECFLYPVYEAWLSRQLTAGTLDLPSGGRLRATDEAKYLEVEFQGRRWAGVDPQKEENANQIAYSMRTKSLSQIIRERAQDPDQVWKEIEEDQAKLEALGITVAADMPPPAPNQPAGADEGEDEDEESSED